MKTFAPRAVLGLLTALAGLALAGCTSAPPRTAQRIEPARDFEVVETSARRPLTAREMTELRASVAQYLDKQNATETGDYYLKIYLTPDQPDVTPEWVVVRFTRYTDTRVAVASGYGSESSFYSYDAYPYGYGGFTRISFQYYDDPFYGPRYYFPRHDHRNHDRDRGRKHDWNHGNDHAGNPPPKPGDHRHDGQANNGGHERPHQPTPDRPTPVQPVVNRPGWNHGPAANPRPANTASQPRENPRQWRGREEANARPPAPNYSAPRTEAPRAPAPAPSYQSRPQPEQRSSSSSSSSDRRENNGNSRKPEQP